MLLPPEHELTALLTKAFDKIHESGISGPKVMRRGIGVGVELPYRHLMRNCITVRDQWMYPREAATRLIGLIRSGILLLEHFDVAAFDLDHVNEAVAYAAAHGGPFKMTVIRP